MKKEILLLVTILLISALLLEAINLSVEAKYKHKRKKKEMGLVYKDTKQVTSSAERSTNSLVFVDDPNGILNFTLDSPRVALIIYSAYCSGKAGATTLAIGINVDGVDQNRMEQSCDDGAIWPGLVGCRIQNLAAGSHTIKGRFCMATNVAPSTQAVVSGRTLTVVLFEGEAADWQFVSSIVAANTNNMNLQNDPNAVVNLNLAKAQKALILYAICNYHAATEGNMGKRIAVQVDGVDSLTLGNFPHDTDWSDHSFIAKLVTLNAGPHTIRGRFSSSDTIAGQNVTISERQLGVLLFEETLGTDYIESTAEVSVVSSSFRDDAEAIVSRNITNTGYLLAIYCAGKHEFRDTKRAVGLKVAINLDGTDYYQNYKGMALQYPAVSSAYSRVFGVPVGSHTVKGRIACIVTGLTSWIFERTLCLLWFTPETPPSPPPEAFEKKEEKQEANRNPPYGFTRMRVLHRVTRIVPWVV